MMKNKFSWEPEVIASCIILHVRSPGIYKYICRSKLMFLPCVSTLRSYIGKSTTGDVGFPPLAEKRLKSLAINPSGRFVSRLVTIEKFLRNVVPLMQEATHIVKDLVEFIKPHLTFPSVTGN